MYVRRLLAALFIMAQATVAQAATLTSTFTQVGADVVLEVSGSVDLTGYIAAGPDTGSGGTINPGLSGLSSGAAGTGDSYLAISGVGISGFGGVLTSTSNSNSGDTIVLAVAGAPFFLILPTGYVSGNALLSSSTFASTDFTTLALTPGSYQASAGNTTFDIIVGAAPVPLPAALPLLLAGFGGLGLLRRRRS